MRFRAWVSRNDMLGRTIKLQVIEQRGLSAYDCLLEDGTWAEVEEGAQTPENAGIALPTGSLEAIVRACMEHLGNSLPSVAEISVLREWLVAERERVDALLNKALNP